jgi:hypothetical protein
LAIENHFPSELIFEILVRFEMENVDFVSMSNKHTLVMAFENNVDFRIFKLLYETSKLNFSKIFIFHEYGVLSFYENQIKILEFI